MLYCHLAVTLRSTGAPSPTSQDNKEVADKQNSTRTGRFSVLGALVLLFEQSRTLGTETTRSADKMAPPPARCLWCFLWLCSFFVSFGERRSMETYSLLRVIGEGSFGRAVLVCCKNTQQKYVLKEIQLSKVCGITGNDVLLVLLLWNTLWLLFWKVLYKYTPSNCWERCHINKAHTAHTSRPSEFNQALHQIKHTQISVL